MVFFLNLKSYRIVISLKCEYIPHSFLVCTRRALLCGFLRWFAYGSFSAPRLMAKFYSSPPSTLTSQKIGKLQFPVSRKSWYEVLGFHRIHDESIMVEHIIAHLEKASAVNCTSNHGLYLYLFITRTQTMHVAVEQEHIKTSQEQNNER